MTEFEPHLDPTLLTHLAAGERIEAAARAADAVLAVSDRRVVVAVRDRITLSLDIDGLRRIQFDIEKTRPATLVIVPESSREEPQVLAIPHEHIRDTAALLGVIGERLGSRSATTS
jgi:hypothetical protein